MTNKADENKEPNLPKITIYFYYTLVSIKYLKVIIIPLVFLVLDLFFRLMFSDEYNSLIALLILLNIFFGMATALNYKSLKNPDSTIEFKSIIQLSILAIWVIVEVLLLLIDISVFANIVIGIIIVIVFFFSFLFLVKHNKNLIQRDYSEHRKIYMISRLPEENIDPITNAKLKG